MLKTTRRRLSGVYSSFRGDKDQIPRFRRSNSFNPFAQPVPYPATQLLQHDIAIGQCRFVHEGKHLVGELATPPHKSFFQTICKLIRSDLLDIKAITPTAFAIIGHSLPCRRPRRYCCDSLLDACGI